MYGNDRLSDNMTCHSNIYQAGVDSIMFAGRSCTDRWSRMFKKLFCLVKIICSKITFNSLWQTVVIVSKQNKRLGGFGVTQSLILFFLLIGQKSSHFKMLPCLVFFRSQVFKDRIYGHLCLRSTTFMVVLFEHGWQIFDVDMIRGGNCH